MLKPLGLWSIGVLCCFHLSCSSSTSVSRVLTMSELLAALPNLAHLSISEAGVTLHRESHSRSVPSPADTRLEIRGSMRLSCAEQVGAAAGFQWEAIDRARVPTPLREHLPDGRLEVCEAIARSFQSNAVFAHGFVVRVVGTPEVLYIIARDLDHALD